MTYEMTGHMRFSSANKGLILWMLHKLQIIAK